MISIPVAAAPVGISGLSGAATGIEPLVKGLGSPLSLITPGGLWRAVLVVTR